MPNETNIARPLTLIGLGRSGTTLLEACFNRHPQIQTLNETSGLIFGVAAGAFESALPSKERFSDPYAFAGAAIRTTLMALEPSDRLFWFHKPGGLPKLISWVWQDGRKTPTGFPVEWYWRVMKSAFPRSLFITSLRNPWDVVLSWERYIGWRQQDVWHDVADVYDMLDTGFADIGALVFFEDLITQPEQTLRAILSLAGVPFDDAVLAGFAQPQALKPGDQPRAHHREDWDRCEPPPITEDGRERIMRVWRAAGRSFGSPPRFADLFPFDASA
ncbi:sulfotransferase family protein [Rhodopila sp.]|uniref:sulfotransferase family protein n=1 Tax=Rhodopila sp. TaxID=2480087 RepID=UPI002B952441|nr:sulfotransferase [Rhodopila sp.]HVZ07133.1 sulfotransferase [Rhodopila sp.]